MKIQPLQNYAHTMVKKSTNSEQFEYFSSYFTKVELQSVQKDFIKLFPRYIYTLNIDDGVENNCNEYRVVLPCRNFLMNMLIRTVP